ncbi:exopolyphosphatase [Abditibacterium utsteinense]|uniref:Exopolyphosphatase n=1 Tax=Abditibacterium utsteinense TaxID=1960156 RepID=A0A2S8SV56_9BACT|nr:exopolyphosphatase [Abditibacterium utsteinense]PQV64688.1 exopolyphosphatase [Abditibacterium utsteinense]
MRLLTRSDFDGLACAVLLKDVGLIDRYKFVHPKDIQDGKIEVSENDVLANVPYVPGCGLWFDHHTSEGQRLNQLGDFEGDYREAPSCARVIWDFYGGENTFDPHFLSLMEAVDKSDSGNLNQDDIEHPRDWILLSYVMDPRTGLGRYRDYRISNYQLMEDMVEHCRNRSIGEILALPDVTERVTRYYEQTGLFRAMLRKRAVQQGNVIALDLREQEEIYAGNRFAVYTMFPDANVSLQMMWGFQKQNIVLACGHSITNRTCRTDIGKIMLEFGGGGHRAVGACQIPVEDADATFAEIIERLREKD